MKYSLPSLLSCFLVFAFALRTHAQQDPLYSQYFNNPLLINPAFAGSNERLYAGVGYRSQWTGVDGGPATFNFNSHISLMENKIGAGLIVVEDKIGDIRNTQYGVASAYRIRLKNSIFSFGMKAGFMQYTSNLSGVLVRNPDTYFAPFAETKFNIGTGVLLKSDRYTLGFSAPQLLSHSIRQGENTMQVYSQNYYLYAADMFFVTENIQFKPSVLLRATKGSSISADANFNFTYNRTYTAGLFTRKLNTYGLLLQAVLKRYRVGYVFEVPGKGSSLNFTTHEISLALSFDVLREHEHMMTGF